MFSLLHVNQNMYCFTKIVDNISTFELRKCNTNVNNVDEYQNENGKEYMEIVLGF